MKAIYKAVVVLICSALVNNASKAEEQPFRKYLYNYLQVPTAGVKEVFTLDPSKQLRNSLVVSTVGLTYWQDKNIRNYWQENLKNEDLNDFSTSLYNAGTPIGMFKLYAATSATGLMLQDQYLLEATSLSIQAALVSQLFAETAKKAGGRKRPHESNGNHARWGEDGKSFFSGHASGTFAAMAVFADQYRDNSFIYWGAYTFATAVSISRINDDGHWASDVLLGALVGIGLGKLTVAMSPFKNNEKIVFMPYSEKNSLGVTLQYVY